MPAAAVSDLEQEAQSLAAALEAKDDPAQRERLAGILAELGRPSEAAPHLRALLAATPDRPKLWRALATALCRSGDYDGAAHAWIDCLERGAELERLDPKAGLAFLERMGGRLFAFLADLIETATVADPEGMAGRWRLVRRIYSDPSFATLALRFPDRFDAFVSLSGEVRAFGEIHKHGADMSPLVDEALMQFTRSDSRVAVVRACHSEIARAHGGLDEITAKARRLLDDPVFNAPVIICGFHHSGTRLLARLMAEIGVFQRINTFQYEWSFANQLNTLLAPGCMDPARAETLRDPEMVSAERLAFRLAMAGLEAGVAWGFKDPRNCLTASAWLKAFPNARVLHIVRDPVATLGSLPDGYDRFVRLDQERPTAIRFWIQLWEQYVQGARDAMARAAASIEIRFEDLCQDPIGTLERIVEGLGLDLKVEPQRLRDVQIETGKTALRHQLREEGRLSPGDLQALETLGERYGYVASA